MERDARLDALRGLMLVFMANCHFCQILFNSFIEEPFGYVSAAEGFVFISGYVSGLVYIKRFQRGGKLEVVRRAWRRARLIYLCHVLTLLAAWCLMQWKFQMGSYDPTYSLDSMWNWLLENHWANLLAGVFLASQPPFLDILSMYCGFILFAPTVIFCLDKFKLIITISFSIWLLVQLGVSHWLAERLQCFSFIHFGYFNFFAWQFLFVLGLVLGAHHSKNPSSIIRFNGVKLVLLCEAALTLFTLRHGLTSFLYSKNMHWLVERSTLGPLRIINLLLIASLIGRPGLWPPSGWWVKSLSYLGRNSLLVFSCHIVYLYIVVVVDSYIVSFEAKSIVVLTGVASLYLPVCLLDLWKRLFPEP